MGLRVIFRGNFFRGLAASLFAALLLGAGLSEAQADHTSYGGGAWRGAVPRSHGRSHSRFRRSRPYYSGYSNRSVSRFDRLDCERSGYGNGGCGCRPSRYVGGSSWAQLRRYLPTSHSIREFYVRNYFLRRYPYVFADGETRPGITDAEDTETKVLGDGKEPHELTERERLNLGMRSYLIGRYTESREHFDAVLAATPKHAIANYGRLMTSVGKSDWKNGSAALAKLAEIGELRKEDKLVVDGVFGDPKKFDAILNGLKTHTRWSPNDGGAHVVAAWLYGARGDENRAALHLKKAVSWNPSHAAIKVLQGAASDKKAEPDKKAEEKVEPKADAKKSAPTAAPTEDRVIAVGAGLVPARAPGSTNGAR